MYSSYNSVLKKIGFVCVFVGITALHVRASQDNEQIEEQAQELAQERLEEQERSFDGKPISDIIISGNLFVPVDAILDRIPYRIGEFFDRTKTRVLISNLYYDLKRFRNISIYAKDGEDDTVVLHVVL